MIRNAAFLTLAVSLAACSSTPGERMDRFLGELDVGGADWNDAPMQDTNVTGRLAGEMPHVGSFDEAEGYGYGWVGDDWIDVQLHGVGDYGWAMIGLSAAIDSETGEVLDDTIYVIGCSGPEDGWAEFDAPAEDAQVQIERVVIDGVDVYQIEVAADFQGGDSVVAVAQAPVGI